MTTYELKSLIINCLGSSIYLHNLLILYNNKLVKIEETCLYQKEDLYNVTFHIKLSWNSKIVNFLQISNAKIS